MNTTMTPRRLAPSDEPIPGYRLIEIIGRGGYGEVWRASAPGGVSKAIKLIYEDRSAHGAMELLALNRIKDVRHPFLVSIDRIEQLPGMLAIVTELADRNLQQHCQAYQEKGLPGIPQEELLALLRDVAEVLDFIYQEFALQHLDVKAANLLQFGRHLKVGDFGLVKNIFQRATSQPQPQALTPAYAAPEIFQGKPSGSSDQYSLAIVYLEMLTGTLPFRETSAAKLALQHLQDLPRLHALPVSQQPVIARALSKNPQQRYPSCTRLLEDLTAACRNSAPSQSLAAASCGPSLGRDVLAKAIQTSSLPQKPCNAPSASLSETSTGSSRGTLADSGVCPNDGPEYAPTIVIALGGSAAQVLRRFRLRISDRLGDKELSRFLSLVIDTDHDVASSTPSQQTDTTTVIAPLQSAVEYREQGLKHRRWLPRRWLFNIPRSLKTDGLRPLGRLALMTNATRIKAELRAVIQKASAPEGGQPPRILFISSISGGTGSGMLLDLAYAARAELQSAGHRDGTVDALLLHSTPIGSDHDKAILNSVALLREMAHYSTAGNYYPGEPLLDVSPFHGNNQTFRSVRLIHLGDHLDVEDWLSQLDAAAEFAYLDLAAQSPAFPFAATNRPAPRDPTLLDVIQVRQIGGYTGEFAQQLSQQISVDVVRGWCGQRPEVLNGSGTPNATLLIQTILRDDEQHRPLQFDELAAAQIQAIGVDLKRMIASAREMLKQELGMDPREYLRSLFQQAQNASKLPQHLGHELAARVLSLLDRAIGLDFSVRAEGAPHNTLFDLLNSRMSSQAMQLSSKLTGWIYDLVDDPHTGIEGARVAAEACRRFLGELVSASAKEVQAIQKEQIDARIELASPSLLTKSLRSGGWWLNRRNHLMDQLESRLADQGLVCLDELVLNCVRQQLRSLEAQTSAVIDKLNVFHQEVREFEKKLSTSMVALDETDAAQPLGFEERLRVLMFEHREQLVEELRKQIDQDILSGPKKLQRFLLSGSSLEQQLLTSLKSQSRKIVLSSMKQVLLLMLRQESAQDEAWTNLNQVLASLLQEPMGFECSTDSVDRLVAVPAECSTAELEGRWSSPGRPVEIVSVPTNNVVVVQLVSGVTVFEAIQQIALRQPALISLADSLCARTDVQWMPAGRPSSHVEKPLDVEELTEPDLDVCQTKRLTHPALPACLSVDR